MAHERDRQPVDPPGPHPEGRRRSTAPQVHTQPDDTVIAASPLISYLTFPLRGASLGVLLLFALLAVIVRAAGLFGVWLGLILLIMISGYAFRLLDSVSEGRQRPPEMSAKLINPANERRPLWLLLAALVGVGGWEASGVVAPGWPTDLLAVVLLLLLPAGIALLGLRLSEPINLFNPVVLVRTALGMGPYYPVVLGVIAAAGVAIRFAGAAPLSRGLTHFFALYAVLAVFSVIGGSLYSRRRELGTETVESPEQREARRELGETRERDRFLDEIYRLVRAGRLQSAFDQVAAYLVEQDDRLAEHAAVFDALGRWEDKRAALGIGQGLVSALIEARRSSEALAVAERCLGWSSGFFPARAAEALRLANAARDGGRYALAGQFLRDFESRYPGDPASAVATRMRAELAELMPRPAPGNGG